MGVRAGPMAAVRPTRASWRLSVAKGRQRIGGALCLVCDKELVFAGPGKKALPHIDIVRDLIS